MITADAPREEQDESAPPATGGAADGAALGDDPHGSPGTPQPLRGAPGFLARRLYQAYSAAWLRHVDTTLTGPQFAVLTAVREYPGVDQGKLAVSVALDRSTMADVCKRLEDRELIRRDTAPADGRRKLLTLTDAGGALLDDVNERVGRLHSELMSGTGEAEEFARLLVSLDELSRRWERVAEGEPVPRGRS